MIVARVTGPITMMSKAGFNPLVAAQSLPPVPLVQGWARDWSGARGPLVDLSQAVPGYPPHPDLLDALADAARSHACAGYGAIEGDAALRQAYAAHLLQVYGAEVMPDNVQVTAGCNQAFFAVALALAGRGDAVAMSNPAYFNHETTLAMLGIGVRRFDLSPADGFLPDSAAIDASIVDGVRAVAIVTPNNPTGAIYPPGLLDEIFDVCARRGVWLILDETYRDFLPPDATRPHDLFARPGWEATLIQLYSFSKSFCIPGHRLGAIAAGSAVVAEVAKIMDNLQICAPRPAQAAVASTLAPLAAWRDGNRREIAGRAAALRDAMRQLPGWTVESLGAYFAYVRHPFGAESSLAVAERMAREAGVLVIPGTFFGEGQEPYLRFAFANADAATIAELPGRLAAMTG